MRIRMLRSTTRTAPLTEFASNALAGSLAIGANRPKVSESLQPQLTIGTSVSPNDTTWRPLGPVMVGTDTMIPTLTDDTLRGSSGTGLLRYVPPTNTTFPLVDSQPGLEIYYAGWTGIAGNYAGVTNGPTGTFAKNLRFGSGNLVNYTQGGTISIGAKIGSGTTYFDATKTLSTAEPPGSIFLTPQGVPKTPNSSSIARNTLIGNKIWRADAPLGYAWPSGPPIYNAGTCSDITAIGIEAAYTWGQNQTYSTFINRGINVKGGTLIGYQAAYWNCGPPTNAPSPVNTYPPANVIAIGSQALYGIPTVLLDEGSYPTFVKFPGGNNIAIGYKSLAGNTGAKFWPRDNPREDCNGCTTIGNNIFTTFPIENSQDHVRNFGYIGGSQKTTIIGINASPRFWKVDNCLKIVYGNKPLNAGKGDFVISIGDIYQGKRDIWEESNDIVNFTKKCIYIGKNTVTESGGLPSNTTGAICLGQYTMYTGDNTVAFGTNGNRLLSISNKSNIDTISNAYGGTGASVYISQGPTKPTSSGSAAVAVGGINCTFKILVDGVSQTATVRNGIIISIK